jgi:hypothetical protein
MIWHTWSSTMGGTFPFRTVGGDMWRCHWGLVSLAVFGLAVSDMCEAHGQGWAGDGWFPGTAINWLGQS